MSNCVSHNWALCRAAYQVAREHGAPSVNIVNFGGGFFVGETAKDQVRIDGVTGCCKWAMKLKVAEKWLESHKGFSKELRGLSPDRRTNVWQLTCLRCRHVFRPSTTMLAERAETCPKCGQIAVVNYNAD